MVDKFAQNLSFYQCSVKVVTVNKLVYLKACLNHIIYYYEESSLGVGILLQ